MISYIIEMESYTSARSAVRYLNGIRIKAQVQKISSGRNGCVFGIRVSEEPEKVCDRLKGAGIRYGLIRKGG